MSVWVWCLEIKFQLMLKYMKQIKTFMYHVSVFRSDILDLHKVCTWLQITMQKYVCWTVVDATISNQVLEKHFAFMLFLYAVSLYFKL